MENNFNMTVFKKHVDDSIIIDDEIAEKYYQENKEIIFINHPFTKIAPGINANVIIMDNNKKNDKEYQSLLLKKEKCIPIENYNPRIMQIEDDLLAEALLNMEVKTYKKITLKNNQKIMIYKISHEKGEWENYSEVANQVKTVLKKKLSEENCLKKINDLKENLGIKIAQKNLEKYIENKNNLLRSKDSGLDDNDKNRLESIDNNDGDSETDLSSDEIVQEQKIKEVEQEVVR